MSYVATSTGDHRVTTKIDSFERSDVTLEDEFQSTVWEENHKKNVNDAKMRAVAQRVPDYEGFHQMVLGADLKPMEKKDKGHTSMFEGLQMDKKTQFFGSDLYKQTATAETFGATPMGGAQAAAAAGEEKTEFAVPRNPMEFTREWQKSCRTAATRGRYLASLPPRAEWWGGIFKGGIDVGILGEIFCCWAEGWAAEGGAGLHPGCEEQDAMQAGHTAASRVAQALVGLAGTSRYELNLSLMSSDEVEALSALCENVRGTLTAEVEVGGTEGGPVLVELCESYSAYLEADDGEQLPMAE